MAFIDVDPSDCFDATHLAGGAVTLSSNAISVRNLDKQTLGWAHHRLVAEVDLSTTSFSMRAEVIFGQGPTSKPTFWANSVLGISSHPGERYSQAYGALVATGDNVVDANYMHVYCSTDGGASLRFALLVTTDGSDAIGTQLTGFSENTRYFVTVEWDHTAGTYGTATMTIRTGSHSGTVVNSNAVAALAAPTQTMKFFMPWMGEGIVGGGARRYDMDVENPQVDGFEVTSDSLPGNLLADMTTYDLNDPNSNYTLTPTSLLMDPQSRRELGYLMTDLGSELDEDWDFYCELRYLGGGASTFNRMGGMPCLADWNAEAGDELWKSNLAAQGGSGNAISQAFESNSGTAPSTAAKMMAAGTELISRDTASLTPDTWYFLKSTYTNNGGVNSQGRLRTSAHIGHPDNPRVWGNAQVNDFVTKPTGLRYFYVFASWHSPLEADRVAEIEIRNVQASFLAISGGGDTGSGDTGSGSEDLRQGIRFVATRLGRRVIQPRST